MEHNWIKVEHDCRKLCSQCGLYAWYDVRSTPCNGPKFVDNDTLRPPVSERAKRELGHNLKEYDDNNNR